MILTFGSTATHDATSDQISNHNMYLHFTRLKTRLTPRGDNGELSRFRSVGGTKRIPGKQTGARSPQTETNNTIGTRLVHHVVKFRSYSAAA